MSTPVPTRMVDIDVGILVWVFFSVYLVALLLLGVYGWWRESRLATSERKMEDHFLASRGLGTLVSCLTIFATISSGYVVVGIPGEVWQYGYFGFRWLYTTGLLLYPIMFLGSQLQMIACERQYVSPTDFIKDRYKSWILTWFTSLIMIFPAVVYAIVQFVALGATIQEISDDRIDNFVATRILCVVMIMYEVFGGLRAIAYTDVIQGVMLIAASLLFYVAQEDIFGGVNDAYPVMVEEGTTVNLSDEQIHGWIGFGMMVCISYGFYPQMIVRYQAAKSGSVLKWANVFLTVATWIVMSCSIITGMVAISYVGHPSEVFTSPNSVFGLVVRRVINENTAYGILGSIMLTASAAAFMSTADSAINAASSLLTLDFIAPILPIDFDRRSAIVLWGGKGMSIGIAVIVLFWSQVDMEMASLIELQGMILCQAVPAFLLGFFWLRVHPYSLLIGQAVGVFISLGYQCGADNCLKSSVEVDWFGPITGLHPGFFALFINVLVASVGSFISAPKMPDLGVAKFDRVELERFHDVFPERLLSLKADGTARPWNYFPWNILFFTAFILHCFSTPWYNNQGDAAGTTLPQWVTECGISRLLGDIFLITSIIFGWQDESSESTTTTELEIASSTI